MNGLIAIDGRIATAEDAAVPALDRGFLMGDAIFEVMVAFHGKILNLSRHLDRLQASAEAIAVDLPWTPAVLEFELQTLVDQLSLPKAYLRLVITRGHGLGLAIPAQIQPHRYAFALPAPIESPSIYREGLSLKRTLRTHHTERGPHPKTPYYLPSILALQRANREGCQDILWTNSEGEITEASSANIFFLARDGDAFEFITPATMSGILPGITRITIIELMQQAGLPVREQIVYADELPRFDEAFLCSSIRGLVPVARIDQQRLFSTRPSAAFRHIERLFMTWVETQVGVRVDWATGSCLP